MPHHNPLSGFWYALVHLRICDRLRLHNDSTRNSDMEKLKKQDSSYQNRIFNVPSQIEYPAIDVAAMKPTGVS